LGKQRVVSKEKAYMVFGVALILMTATSPMVNRHFVLPILSVISIIAISFLFSGKKSTNLFCGVLLMVLLMFSELIIGAIVIFVANMYFIEIRNTMSHYMVGVLASTLFAFLLVKIIGYKKVDIYRNISLSTFLGLLLIPIFSMIIIYGMAVSIQYYQDSFFMAMFIGVSILVCLSNFLVFYLFESQMKSNYVQARLELIEKQVEQQTEYYKDISMRQIEVRKLSHDMNHYLSGIWGFLNEKKYEEAVRCLEQISADLKNALSEYVTGHPALDAVLRLKKRQMDDLGIQFDSSVILPAELEVDTLDLCVILGNGLDNAIEACEKISDTEKRFIWLNMRMCSQYMLSICIENAISQNGIPETFPRTSKQDVLNHGFGLESMQSVIDKYNGNLNISHANDIFQLAVLVQNI